MSNPYEPLFVTDEAGNRTAVILPLAVYAKLLDAYEHMADFAAIRDYEADKAAGTVDAIPFEAYLATHKD